MANEWTLMWETEQPVPMTCSNSVGIEKGTVLKLSDPRTVATATADNDPWGGIAAEEKIANDGKTVISVYFGGIFKGLVGAAGCTAGKAFSISAANAVVDAAAGDNDVGYTGGKSLETGTNGETALFFVGKA
jgi:hypothetical protein